jgi:hypothetical protein
MMEMLIRQHCEKVGISISEQATLSNDDNDE